MILMITTEGRTWGRYDREIAPLPQNQDYLQNMKMKKNTDWLNQMRK